MTDPWDPELYARFAQLRRKPFFDLVAMLPPGPFDTVVDLGCGTGELTWDLHRRVDARSTLGVDSSANMLTRGRAMVAERAVGDALRFVQDDILRFARDPASGTYDLVFSHAALQWLPDHPSLFEVVGRRVACGGVLAVQMPANHDHIAHLVANDVASSARFASKLGGFVRQSPVLAVERYAELLYAGGFVELDVRLQVYAQELPDRESVVTWMQGTALTPYAHRLDAPAYAEFLAAYRAALFAATEERTPFFFPYKRLLMTGRRRG